MRDNINYGVMVQHVCKGFADTRSVWKAKAIDKIAYVSYKL
jgi:hypothetical protein